MRRTPALQLCALALALAAAAPADARISRAWNYDDLHDAADLVVIAYATKTTVRPEQAELPNIYQTKPNGTTGPVMGQRVETELQVRAVLKGKPLDAKGKKSKLILLHHYAEVAGAGPVLDGPMLISFDPKAKTQYLMFLDRGPDGQYVAVSGQTDPWYSIDALRHQAP